MSASYCVSCGIRTEDYCLILNKDWLDFCEPCANKEVLTNAETGHTIKVIDLINGEKSVKLDASWCECDEPTFNSYPEDDECICGVYKHHIHCNCGKISQVG